MEEFIPTTLGVALVQGYDDVGFEISLSKPFLRKEMELRMKDICEGRKTREEVVRDSLRQYKQVFQRTEDEIGVLKAVRFFLSILYGFNRIGKKTRTNEQARLVGNTFLSSLEPIHTLVRY